MSQAVVAKLKEAFPAVVGSVREHRGEWTVVVDRAQVVAVCRYLKEQAGYNFLCDLCGVDYLGRQPRFEVVYNLYNIATKERLRLKVQVPEADACVETVSGVWSTANWHERECWDLLGIRFANHPDLRRILMPDNWQGHPLRKDYPLQGPGREPYQGRLS
ncbi:MAG: NADH-quinone oxidoreductase subunit C [Desulfuromonas thiophila]|jgi:NADH-quinone oxidoreductase subunit C|nr:NADH-quinone oxidoreductase subunit C [Desulfuromonas thiophila]MDY0398321.1 NADH-quinone oxidoreductase subunit C [Desulfuromonas thiophila]